MQVARSPFLKSLVHWVFSIRASFLRTSLFFFVLGYGGEGDERHCNCCKSENFLFHKSNVFLKLLFVILFAFFDKNNNLAFNLAYSFNSDLTLALSVS